MGYSLVEIFPYIPFGIIQSDDSGSYLNEGPFVSAFPEPVLDNISCDLIRHGCGGQLFMERVFIADSVIHSADQYLVMGVQFHSGCLLLEFPAEFEYRFDERFVLQWGSGHFGDLWGGLGRSGCFVQRRWGWKMNYTSVLFNHNWGQILPKLTINQMCLSSYYPTFF